MKNKLFKSLGLTVLLLTLLVSNVFAFSFGTTDGVWSRIDDTNLGHSIGATCERYGRVVPDKFTPIDTLGIINNVRVGPGGVNEKYVRSSSVCQGDPDGDMGFADNNSFGEWTRSDNFTWTSLGSHTAPSCTASDLFISEYIFVTDNQIGIEIYNGTGGDVSLSTYSLLLFRDDRNFDRIALTGSVSADDVHVVVSNAARDSTDNEDQWFTNNTSYRTVVLVKDFVGYNNLAYRGQSNRMDMYNYSPTDENQVRYGQPSGSYSCPGEGGGNTSGYLLQSGFGFNGHIDTDYNPEVGELFPVGRFCHYNNIISSPDNALDTVKLSVKINTLNCPTGQSIDPPAPNNSLEFDFVATLDETSNVTPISNCKYGPSTLGWPGGDSTDSGNVSPNRNGCADMVKFTAPSTNQTFTCVFDATHSQEYHVSLVGFTSTTVGGVCPDKPVGSVSFSQVYTAEQSNNCYCMYASYTKNQITPVTMASFGANWTENGVLIDWETVSETNNFGFNIMRAEIVDGERVQINPEMIFSSIAPGDPFGSTYEYLDETAVPGTEYFYWLVDVPLDSSEPGIYGPISPAE